MITKLQNQSFLGDLRQRISGQKSFDFQKFDGYLYPESKFSAKDKSRIVVEGQSSEKSIEEICQKEKIDRKLFYKWTDEFLKNKWEEELPSRLHQETISKEKKFEIVLEGKSGISSIAEICGREEITQDTFLEWSREFLNVRQTNLNDVNVADNLLEINKRELFNKFGSNEVYNYLRHYIDFSSKNLKTYFSESQFLIDKTSSLNQIVNFQKANDVRYINKYFEAINSKLAVGGVFVGCVETFQARKSRMKINSIPFLRDVYFILEFFIKRILPKVSFTKRFYFDFTKGNDRLLSKAESLGRLVSCGFDIMDFKSVDGLLYFVVRKARNPEFNDNPSYGPVYKMPRLGKNGKIILVYKFRTMHPYSEYLQDFMINAYGYSSTGKPANDFRIPVWGKFLRKFWLDELPQLINVLKGELKLVGIRPVSQRYFQDIPKEMQKLRLSQKPGCIPPYVSLNREGNVLSVLSAEKEYLEEKISNPYTTDIKYFFNAVINILVFHKRSA